jgi:hypothetical protein
MPHRVPTLKIINVSIQMVANAYNGYVILMEIDTLVMGAYMILFSVDDLLKIIQ